jgi:hypothetical protein
LTVVTGGGAGSALGGEAAGVEELLDGVLATTPTEEG